MEMIINIVDIFNIDRQDGQPDDIMLICNDKNENRYYNFVVRSKSSIWYKLYNSGTYYLNRPLKATIQHDRKKYLNAAIVTAIEEVNKTIPCIAADNTKNNTQKSYQANPEKKETKKFKVVIIQEVESSIEIEAEDHTDAYWKAMELWQKCEEPFEMTGAETTNVKTYEI